MIVQKPVPPAKNKNDIREEEGGRKKGEEGGGRRRKESEEVCTFQKFSAVCMFLLYTVAPALMRDLCAAVYSFMYLLMHAFCEQL